MTVPHGRIAVWLLRMVCVALVYAGSATPVHPGTPPDYTRVAFRTLRLYNPGMKAPKDILELNGKKVEILGFMSALTQLEDIDEFLLASSPPMNCYCHPPLRVNELVLVRMKKGKTTEYKPGVVKVRGVLKVHPDVRDEFADVMYTLECDEVL